MDMQLTTKEICMSTAGFSTDVEQAVDGEYTLPDYCPDIKRILRCNMTPFIHNVSMSGNTVNLDGSVSINILYLSGDKKEVRCFEVQSSFSKKVDMPENCDDCDITCLADSEYVNCRAVNERKLDIHGAVSIKVNCRGQKSIMAVSGANCDDVQVRTDKAEFSKQICNADKLIIVNEEISTDESNSPILNIICKSVDIINEDVKPVMNKVVYRCDLSVKFTYLNEDGAYETVSDTVPISQIIESEGMAENAAVFCKSKICGLELKPHTDRNGNCTSAILNCKMLVGVRAWEMCRADIVTDSYSTECDMKKTERRTSLLTIGDKTFVSQSQKAVFDISDGIGDVICIYTETPDINVTPNGQNAVISGNVPIGIVYINSEGDCCYAEKDAEIELQKELGDEYNSFDFVCRVGDIGYTIDSDTGIEVRFDIKINILPMQLREITLIEELSKDESSPKTCSDRPAMTLYFAKKGESVWDIAMRYNTRADDIMKQNELTADILPSPKMLIIPSMA